MLPVPAGFGVASLLAGRAVNKWGPQLPVLTCLAAMFIGLAIFAISMDHAHPVALVGLTIFGAGAGGCATPLLHLGMTKVDDGRAGMAAGMLNLQRSLGGIFGVAFLGTIVAAWLGAALPNTMADEIPDPIARAIVVDVIVDSANPHAHAAFIGPGHRITAAQEDEIVLAADAVFVSGIKLALGGAAVLLTGAFVLGWTRFPGPPPAKWSRSVRPTVPAPRSTLASRLMVIFRSGVDLGACRVATTKPRHGRTTRPWLRRFARRASGTRAPCR